MILSTAGSILQDREDEYKFILSFCFSLPIFRYLLQGLPRPVSPREPQPSGRPVRPNVPHLSASSSRQYHTYAMNHQVCLRLLMHFSINHLVLYSMPRVNYLWSACVFTAILFQIWVYFWNWFLQSVHDGEADPQLVFFPMRPGFPYMERWIQHWSAENPRFIHELPLHAEWICVSCV
jgi:hypothetical protein